MRLAHFFCSGIIVNADVMILAVMVVEKCGEWHLSDGKSKNVKCNVMHACMQVVVVVGIQLRLKRVFFA